MTLCPTLSPVEHWLMGLMENFDSGSIMPGSSFEHRLIKKGTYRYFCVFHPWQTGVVVVE